MDVENISTEGVTDIKVENESDDEVESQLDLYADHVIKEEMVIRPVVHQVIDVTYCPEDVPDVPKKPKLETTDEKTDQVKPQKGMNEDNTERIISNVDFKNNIKPNTALRNNEQTNCKQLQKFNQTPGICNESGKKFQEKSKLAQDVICHTKNLSCSHCDYKCNQKGNLSKHLRTHTGEKPYSCSHCDYKCNERGNLSKHLRTHTGVKLYSCSQCEYKCNQKGDLSEHLHIHTGEKPYSCSHCDYKCKQKHRLSVHLRIHSGEKPYSCSHCDYRFNEKSTLTKHLRTHTGEKPYSCSHCDFKCRHKYTLSKHLRTHEKRKH